MWYEVVISSTCLLLMLVMAFIVFDWGRGWWLKRRYEELTVKVNGGTLRTGTDSWSNSYAGYKLGVWLVRVGTWLLTAWHLWLAVLWFVDLWFSVVTS